MSRCNFFKKNYGILRPVQLCEFRVFSTLQTREELSSWFIRCYMDFRPPRFLIMVTVAIFLFLAAAALLVSQSKPLLKPEVEVAE